MAKRRHTPEQVINKLREAEVAISGGSMVAEAPVREVLAGRTGRRSPMVVQRTGGDTSAMRSETAAQAMSDPTTCGGAGRSAWTFRGTKAATSWRLLAPPWDVWDELRRALRGIG